MIVERVSYEIDWRRFKRGYSVFIPCLNPPKAKKEILATTKRLKFEIVIKVVIENKVRGIRLWRV
tara:strand:+ start:1195 stop:1389 length:195 start_codon:yes stop_codon:yes gene_type:complete